ncbi:hypothetical protein PDIDSM_8238 [Penicillium digitatum]|nr:hypothetical protein PDIDSM_8238 [Penicillium digitatum]
MSDVSNSPDTKCFEALPLDTFKAIGWRNTFFYYCATPNCGEAFFVFHSEDVIKEPDESWVPMQPAPGRDKKKPTVVVEVGVSEAYAKLIADAEWWPKNSKGNVKLAVIISVSREIPMITFETVALDANFFGRQPSRYVPTNYTTVNHDIP